MNLKHLVPRLPFGPATLLETAQSALGVATKGLPALRAALHGARLGAGAALDSKVIERLGIRVVRDLPITPEAGARALMVVGKDGVAMNMAGRIGVAASATESTIRTIARSSTTTALSGVLRATRQGAVAGAVVDAAFGVVEGAKAIREGSMTPKGAAGLVAKRAARGATSGAAGVAAAGAASAVVAATGLAFAGAPIVVPIVTMVAAGALVSRGFDRVFGA